MTRIAQLNELHRMYDEFDALPDEEVMARVIELEEKAVKYFETQMYEAFGGDSEKLKAADYHNELYDNLQIFDICHAGGEEHKRGIHQRTGGDLHHAQRQGGRTERLHRPSSRYKNGRQSAKIHERG